MNRRLPSFLLLLPPFPSISTSRRAAWVRPRHAAGAGGPGGGAAVAAAGFPVPPESYHNLANGLHGGPDGWLYGRCGASAPGRVGTPGTPDAMRTPINGGLWRYDP